jgi:hypothetical protein
LLNKANALLYATVPGLVEVEQSNPNVFDAAMFVPEYFGKFGLVPSNPPCKATINLRDATAMLSVKVEVVNAFSNVPEYAVATVG